MAHLFGLRPFEGDPRTRLIDPPMLSPTSAMASLAKGRRVLEKFVAMLRRQSRDGVTLHYTGRQHDDGGHGWRVAMIGPGGALVGTMKSTDPLDNEVIWHGLILDSLSVSPMNNGTNVGGVTVISTGGRHRPAPCRRQDTDLIYHHDAGRALGRNDRAKLKHTHTSDRLNRPYALRGDDQEEASKPKRSRR